MHHLRFYVYLYDYVPARLGLFSVIYVIGCQYKLQDNNGSFSSPNFPNNLYPDFQVCSWAVTVNISLKISLSFLTLNIPNCKENYLEIYDGSKDDGSTLLAKFCDENAASGAQVVSKANSLYIVLKSGNNSARNTEELSKGLGFYAKYEAFQQGTGKSVFLHTKN